MLEYLMKRTGRKVIELISNAGDVYDNLRERARDVRYGAGEISAIAVETIDDVRITATETVQGYRETSEAMNNIRGFLARYDPLNSSRDDKSRMQSRLMEEIGGIKINETFGQGNIQEAGLTIGLVAYFMTHPKDHTLFCAIDTFYHTEE